MKNNSLPTRKSSKTESQTVHWERSSSGASFSVTQTRSPDDLVHSCNNVLYIISLLHLPIRTHPTNLLFTGRHHQQHQRPPSNAPRDTRRLFSSCIKICIYLQRIDILSSLLVGMAQRTSWLDHIPKALFLRLLDAKKKVGCDITHKDFQLRKTTLDFPVPQETRRLATYRDPYPEPPRCLFCIQRV